MTEQPTPWWQRELNARLARKALRREALRRVAVRALGAAGLTAIGLLMVLVLAQDTQGQLSRGTQRTQRLGMAASAHASPTNTIGVPTRTVASKTRAGGALLTLAPPASGGGGSKGSTLRVTLTNRAGAPLPGITIWLTITGLVPYSGASTTDTSGVAKFRYGASGGPYVVHITATADGNQLAQSTVRVGQEPNVATTEITGRFYASDGRCTYDSPPAMPPLFVAHFQTINFAGRPFTDYGATADQPNSVAAHGTDQIGIGRLNHFNAAFTGSLVIHTSGDVPFTFLIDDAFNLGVGGGASRVSGTMSNPPMGGLTALRRLPVVSAFNQGHLEALTVATVRFPRPGIYPFEIDYAECDGGGEAIRISTGGQFLSSTKMGN